jgi:acetate kinase
MASITRIVLALNAGSSSLKFGLYRVDHGRGELLCEGEAEQLGSSASQFWFQASESGEKQTRKLPLQDACAAAAQVLNALQESHAPAPHAVGHRIVHGGPSVREHALVTPELYAHLQQAAGFAPLHVPPALLLLDQARQHWPGIPHVACLDTAFHNTMPELGRTLPLPPEVRALGVERYGFHGLSVFSVVRQLQHVPERTIVAHLGSGCSITALHHGVSQENTMGLTPTGGIIMGTRPGDLDPGTLVFMMRNGYESAEKLETILDRHSGLRAIAETTSDMRELQAARARDPRSDLALRMFAHSIRKAIAAMAAVLNGLDLLVFTGGIGEHAGAFRDEIISGLHFLGRFEIRILPSREDQAIAEITAQICA